MRNIFRFDAWSLRQKLVSVIMLCCTVSMLAGLSLLLTSYVSDRYADSLRSLDGLADVLAENSQAALAFGDPAEAQRLLESLKGHSEIGAAWLVTEQDVVLASWHRSPSLAPLPTGYRINESHLQANFWSQTARLIRPVRRAEKPIGYVLLQADFSEQWQRQWIGLAKGIAAALAALVLMFFWVARLQRLISQPIVDVAQTARAIALDKRYDRRVAHGGQDEIGDLVSAFNQMVLEIQRRDADLTHQRDQLEDVVQLRTRELTGQNLLLEKMLKEQQEREAELERSRRMLREIEQRQLLNAERQRLMQDMHDGLGSSLISALQVVEHGDLQETDIAEVLKACIDDLKLTIDSLETTETDLLLLLATLRFRLTPRLQGSGIRLLWSVQNVPPLEWLDSANALHILRILQECFSNILKHARATQIEVSTRDLGHQVEVCVADNGCGFSVEQAYQKRSRGGGKGLANQLRRAQTIGAELVLSSGAQGSSLSLKLPVSRQVVAKAI